MAVARVVWRLHRVRPFVVLLPMKGLRHRLVLLRRRCLVLRRLVRRMSGSWVEVRWLLDARS